MARNPLNPRLKPEDLDSDLILKLSGIGCTIEEIASLMDCNPKFLMKYFADILIKGRNSMKKSLRRKQYEVAMSGDRTMLIWLGKQYLGQSEKFEVQPEGESKFEFVKP